MLALIAGSGRLPAYLAETLPERPYVAGLEGFVPENLAPDTVFRIETLGTLLGALSGMGVTQVCFAGGIRRPPLDAARIDAATAPLVPRMMAALQQGDDAALRTVIAFFEEAGMRVVGAHEIAPELLPDPGSMSDLGPTRDDDDAVRRGVETVAALGRLDIGQSCVVRLGQVLAVEATPGTDWMLESLTRYDAAGGLFYKAPKPDQDRRVDLPTIGPETVQRAARIGLRGLVIEAGGVMVIDADAARAAADAAGMFIWVRRP